MPLVVSLQDVVGHMDMATDEHIAYINTKTGELFMVTYEDIRLIEGEPTDEELPEWQVDVLAKAKEVLESDDFVELPSRHEIHEYSIMQRFGISVEDDEQRAELLRALDGRGAFRRFNDAVSRLGLRDAWYQHRGHALERIARDWLDAHGIRYTDDE